MPDRMVSMVAKTLKDKRQYDALVDIFQEADTSNDGKVENLNTENPKTTHYNFKDILEKCDLKGSIIFLKIENYI